MKSRTLIATIGTVAALCIVGWMIYDGTQVAEVKTARVKLQPDQPASTVQKNTAGKVQTQPVVSNAAKFQVLPKDKELTKTASADPDKSKKLNFIVPQENLSHLYIVKCSACHGKDGNGPVGPSIAGKSYEYNIKKLQEYKENKVQNTMMEDLLTRTSNEELEQLAKEISQFKPRS